MMNWGSNHRTEAAAAGSRQAALWDLTEACLSFSSTPLGLRVIKEGCRAARSASWTLLKLKEIFTCGNPKSCAVSSHSIAEFTHTIAGTLRV